MTARQPAQPAFRRLSDAQRLPLQRAVAVAYDLGPDIREIAAFTGRGYGTIHSYLAAEQVLRPRGGDPRKRGKDWAQIQANRRRAGNPEDWKVVLLDALDALGLRGNRLADDLTAQWEEQFALLAGFQARHGHINAPPDGPIARWLRMQGDVFLNGAMDPERARRLSELDPFWYDVKKSLTSARTRRYFSLTDTAWQDIEPLLPSSRGHVWAACDHRAVVDALIWKVRTRAAFADINLPGVSRTSISLWFTTWKRAGVWDEIESRAILRGELRPGTATRPAAPLSRRGSKTQAPT